MLGELSGGPSRATAEMQRTNIHISLRKDLRVFFFSRFSVISFHIIFSFLLKYLTCVRYIQDQCEMKF